MFFKYRSRQHTYIVSGMNLPLAFQIAMEPQGKYITEERMKEIIETAKEELKYVNEVSNDEDEEDEKSESMVVKKRGISNISEKLL